MEVNVNISPSTNSEDQTMEIRLNAMSHIVYKIGKIQIFYFSSWIARVSHFRLMIKKV